MEESDGDLFANIPTAIADIVSSIVPFDEKESEHIQFILLWLKSTSQIFRTWEPATPNPHLVVYFPVVDIQERKILLVDPHKGERWFPTGGHVEMGEDPKQAVRREALEELGIEADFAWDRPLLATVTESVWYTEKHTDVSLWYLLRGNSHSSLHFNKKELNEIRWFDWEEIPFESTDPHLRRFLRKVESSLFPTFSNP